MKEINSNADHHHRSSFVREVLQASGVSPVQSSLVDNVPKKIVQFWDNLKHLPKDVSECIDTWKQLEECGVETLLFDNEMARDFISQKLGLRYLQAYDKCYHPAMQSDYFRLCYIYVEGGCYVDADDVYIGSQIEHIFNDGRLKLQPLCYDSATHMMVPPQIFTKPGANDAGWIFYFNNNPLIAISGHPIIEHALSQATLSLEKDTLEGLPEIQTTTGPGNLTKAIFDLARNNDEIKRGLQVLSGWENTARTKWELSYRDDSRNWRHSNCLNYYE